MMAQSPRLSVTAQISRTTPELKLEIWLEAAFRKLSAASRTSPESTSKCSGTALPESSSHAFSTCIACSTTEE